MEKLLPGESLAAFNSGLNIITFSNILGLLALFSIGMIMREGMEIIIGTWKAAKRLDSEINKDVARNTLIVDQRDRFTIDLGGERATGYPPIRAGK